MATAYVIIKSGNEGNLMLLRRNSKNPSILEFASHEGDEVSRVQSILQEYAEDAKITLNFNEELNNFQYRKSLGQRKSPDFGLR